jgi:hypothetical protein
VAIVYPSGDVSTTGWIATPGPNAYAALSDASDATYISSAISGATGPIFDLAQPIYPGTQPVPLRAKVTSGTITVRVKLLDSSNVVLGLSDWFDIASTTITTYTASVSISAVASRLQIEPQPAVDAASGIVTEDGTFLVTEDGTYIVWE